MGSATVRVSVALLLALGAVLSGCVSAARPCGGSYDWSSALFSPDTHITEPTVITHHGDCKAVCNGQEAEKELNTECWGTYVLACKSNSSVMATKCEGHHLGVHILDKHMYLSVCEGLVHRFAHWHSTCPKTGATKVHFFGRGCLGGSASSLQALYASDAAVTSAATLIDPAAYIPSDARTTALAETLRRASAAHGGHHARLSSNATGGAVESRCSGHGGEMFGVKWGKQGEVAEPSLEEGVVPVYHQVQASVLEGITGIPKDLELGQTPAAQTGDASVAGPLTQGSSRTSTWLSTLVQLAHRPNSFAHPTCSLTCNGRTPWLRGKLPCYGVLEVSCSSPDSPPGARTMSFSGSCKGLWTGMFGKMCWGLTLQHSEKSWPSGNAEMDGICSGKQGIWSHHSGDQSSGAFAMGQWCRGSGIGHGKWVKRGDDDAQPSVASVAVA